MAKTECEKAVEIARLVRDGKGQDTVVLDISGLNSWTDFFVITTVSSSTLAGGIYKAVKDYVKENDMEIHLTHHKTSDGSEWQLIDIGTVVVHLMSDEARNFYELENLWHAGKNIEF